MRRRVLLGGSIQLGLRVLNAGLGVGVAALLARGLGIDQYGHFTLALAIVTIGLNVSDFGTAQITTKMLSEDPEDAGRLAGTLFILRTATGCIAACACALIATALLPAGEPRLAGLLIIVLGLAVSGTVSLSAVLHATLRNATAGALLFAQGALWFAAVAFASATNASLIFYALSFSAINATVGAATLVAVTRVTRLDFERVRANAAEIIRQAVPLGAAGLFVTVYYRVDTVLLYQLDSPRSAGLYAAAYRFVDVLQIVPSTITTLLLPVVIRLRSGSAGAAVRAREFAVVLVFAFAAPVAIGSIWVGTDLIQAIFGNEFSDAGALLPLVLAAFVSISLGYVSVTLLVAENEAKVMLPVSASAAAIAVSLNVLLIPSFGAFASATVTLLVEVFVSAVYMRRALRLRIFTFPTARLAGVLVACGIMSAVLWLVRSHGVFVSIPLGGACYLVAVLSLRVIRIRDFRSTAAATGVR